MSYMKSNFKSLVDFKKLRKCNDVCKKWADRSNIGKNDYINFIINLRKNPHFYKDQLEVRFRCQFVKDVKYMFYAFDIENIVVEQFYHSVSSILTNLRITGNQRDELFSVGLYAIRSAVLNFRNHKSNASLFTFVYNGIYQKITGNIFKEKLKTKRRKNFCINESDIFGNKKNKLNMESMAFEKINYDESLEHEEAKDCINKLFLESDLTQDEIYLMNQYMRRDIDSPTWNAKYRENFEKINGKKISKQGVFCKLAKIQRKMWATYSKIKNVPFFDRSNKFQMTVIK